MRAAVATLLLGFLLSSTATGAPAAKKARPAGGKKAAPAAEAPSLDNPYAEGESERSASENEATKAPEEARKGGETAAQGAAPPKDTGSAAAPVSGDPELDAPPTAPASEGDGPGPSPLNPEPEEFPSGKPHPSPADLDALLSDIAALRARVAALTTSLFSSKLRVYVGTDGDDARIDRLSITLDDGIVFRSAEQFVAEDDRIVYEHAVAPGNHVLGVEVERHDARGKTYRTWQSTRVSIVVPDRKLLEVDLSIQDDSDMASDFPDDEDGEYDLRVRARARVVE